MANGEKSITGLKSLEDLAFLFACFLVVLLIKDLLVTLLSDLHFTSVKVG